MAARVVPLSHVSPSVRHGVCRLRRQCAVCILRATVVAPRCVHLCAVSVPCMCAVNRDLRIDPRVRDGEMGLGYGL